MIATQFTPVSAVIGGSMIGLAAVMTMVLLGRIMGISGILGGFFSPSIGSEANWRVPFVVGIVIAPVIYWLFSGDIPQIQIPADIYTMAGTGVLVGFGAALGSGCTSGHGVCGMARLSKRSFVSVVTFMSTAIVTVFVTQHLM
ncbi:YeeE/YedE family protein [Pseudahrensia aquimaris]|uniref:YeeE/YedE family protein n=1 Tax=Pseudahrensia aquimaris TaxID=744461 RepID=A0ABW3FCX2_9HYPH